MVQDPLQDSQTPQCHAAAGQIPMEQDPWLNSLRGQLKDRLEAVTKQAGLCLSECEKKAAKLRAEM